MSWEQDEFRVRKPGAEPRRVTDDDLSRRLTARQFYRAAPPYCIQFENNGCVTLRQKRYEYWENLEPEEATTWITISTHENLEEAERRLRLICTTPVFYDAEGKPTKPPRRTRPRWPAPPTDDE
jgi:hypothetical protein